MLVYWCTFLKGPRVDFYISSESLGLSHSKVVGVHTHALHSRGLYAVT